MNTFFDLKREIACELRRIYIWKGSSHAYLKNLILYLLNILSFLYSKRELLCLDFVESSNDFYLLTDVLFIKLAAYFLTILF